MTITNLMSVKNDYIICEDVYKGMHDEENNVSFVTDDHLFVISSACLLF